MRIENHYRVFAPGIAHLQTISGSFMVAALAEFCRAAVRDMPSDPARIRLDVHQRVCAAIAEYAPGCGCVAKREYRVSNGFIDVVWLKDGKPVVAFEVDGGAKKKSVAKLLSQQCTRCVVSLRDAPLKRPLPDGVNHIILGVRPWRVSRYNPKDT
jgi:hypothetical protein